jgi:putative transposase
MSLPSVRAIAVLEELCTIYGRPHQLRCDKGPEFVAQAMKEWARQHRVHLHFIEPGEPNRNAYIERLNRSFCTEVLDAQVFASLDEVWDLTEPWRNAYNTEQSHESLGRVPPFTFPLRQTAAPEPVRLTGKSTPPLRHSTRN